MNILTLHDIHGSGWLHMAILRALSGNTWDKSMIDLCCGVAPTTSQLGFRDVRYIDIQDRKMDEHVSRWFVKQDVLTYSGLRADVSFCLDGIEHFTKVDAQKLLSIMETVSDRQILFTPLGPYICEPESIGPDTHKSFWFPEHLPEWNHVVFPFWHPTLELGAFYAWKSKEDDFHKVTKQILAICQN